MRFFSFVAIFITLITLGSKVHATDSNRFCIVEVPIVGLTGIATKEKWRAVSTITVFKDSPYPILYSYNGFTRMKLDGYQIREATSDEIPWNSLSENYVLYTDDAGQIYAKGNLWGEDIGVRKLNNKTGEFVSLPAAEALAIKDNLSNLYNPNMILKSGEILEISDDRSEFTLTTSKEKITLPTLYKAHPSNTKNKKLYQGKYFPEAKEYLAYGSLKTKLGFFQEPKLYRIENQSWVEVEGSEKLTDPIVIYPYLPSHAKKKISFVIDFPAPKLAKIYYLDTDKNLKPVQNPYSIEINGSPRFYEVSIADAVLVKTLTSINRLNQVTMSLEPITLPERLIKERIFGLIEMPKSKAILITSGKGIYLMDENLNIDPNPLFEESSIGRHIETLALIPVREEVFISTNNGEHILIDKNISDKRNCTIESNSKN